MKKKILIPILTLSSASIVLMPLISCGDKSFAVTVDSKFDVTIDHTKAIKNQKFSAKITITNPDTTDVRVYKFFDIVVNVGGHEIIRNQDYLFNFYTGEITIFENVITDVVSIYVEPGRLIVADQWAESTQSYMPADGLSSKAFKYTLEKPKVDDKFLFTVDLSAWDYTKQTNTPNVFSFHSIVSQSAPKSEWCEVYLFQQSQIFFLEENVDYTIDYVLHDWIECIKFTETGSAKIDKNKDGFLIFADDVEKSLMTLENDYYFGAWYEELTN